MIKGNEDILYSILLYTGYLTINENLELIIPNDTMNKFLKK